MAEQVRFPNSLFSFSFLTPLFLPSLDKNHASVRSPHTRNIFFPLLSESLVPVRCFHSYVGILVLFLLDNPSVYVHRSHLSLIHISEPTRLLSISYAVF